MILKYLICALAGYLVGTVNPAYILARLKGFDIRKRGSGNAGASNALILFGKLTGILCALFDIAKAAVIVLVMSKIYRELSFAYVVTSVACILGHIFPFYMKFRGGKGLACLGGVILAFDWRVFLIMLACETVIVLLTKYICFVPMSASFIFAAIYGIFRRDLIGVALLLVIAAVIVWKHRENIRRIRKGTEARISTLWNKDKELERVQKNMQK